MGNFVDQVRILAKAGDGGDGCISFHRDAISQMGGPDGGDGGRGGNVILFADPNMHTLLDFRFRRKYVAANGLQGSGNRSVGKWGEDLVIKVPVGTVVRDQETGKVVMDMDTAEESRVILKGGKGGWGNSHFATPTRQAPNFAKPGIKTEMHAFVLELKTIADVGLVGYPNVGKSSILSVLTHARPKIGNYHFTTLTPNLGIVQYKQTSFVLADIPGLVDGASEGAGLGLDFLRHVDRTRLLLHVVDISGSEGRDPMEDFDSINRELQNYGDLANRPQLIVCNKMDLTDAEEYLEMFREHVAPLGWKIFPVSAATHAGFDALIEETVRMLSELPPIQHYVEEVSYEQENRRNSYEIKRVGGVYEVTGSSMDFLISSVNFDDEESMNWFHKTLRAWGVIDELRKAGAAEGDTVRIEEIEFDFVE